MKERLAPLQHIDEYRGAQFTDEFAQKSAEINGCVVDRSQPHLLQLDLDGESAYRTFLVQVRILFEHGLLPPNTRVVAHPSKSGNIHVILVMPEGTDWPVTKRIMVQALLGSDLKREALSLVGHQVGSSSPILLFRPKFRLLMPAYFDGQEVGAIENEMSSNPF